MVEMMASSKVSWILWLLYPLPKYTCSLKADLFVSPITHEEIAETEVNAIRMQIAELCLQDQPVPENRSPSTPPITFVVTQSNHNLVIAPDESHHRQCNVPGGTSLRKSNILPRTHHLDGDENNINGMDFFLTAHQGLKGTSKPILYRCLVNEDSNTVPLDRDALRRVTYVSIMRLDFIASLVLCISAFRCSFCVLASELPIRHGTQGDS